MKCNRCGTFVQSSAEKCPSCGNVFAPTEEFNTPTKTKSRTLAGILMLFGLGDFYLCQPGRYLQKLIVGLFTLFIGTAIMQISDTIKIFSGAIDCDANGTPLV